MKQSGQPKIVARLGLIVLLVVVGGDLLSIYQTHYQLASPLIPPSVTDLIIGPIVSVTIVSSFCCLGGWILFIYRKYVWVIVICGLALVWQWINGYFIS